MDRLLDFQQSFREPVFGFLATFWPVLGVLLLMGLGWLFGSLWQRARSLTGSSDSGGGSFGDADGGGGGDGGGD